MEVSLGGSREGPHLLRSRGTSDKDKRQERTVVSAASHSTGADEREQPGNIYPLLVTGHERVCCAAAA